MLILDMVGKFILLLDGFWLLMTYQKYLNRLMYNTLKAALHLD